jgi:hypothetical protein
LLKVSTGVRQTVNVFEQRSVGHSSIVQFREGQYRRGILFVIPPKFFSLQAKPHSIAMKRVADRNASPHAAGGGKSFLRFPFAIGA